MYLLYVIYCIIRLLTNDIEKLNSIEQSQYSDISLFFGNLYLSCIRGKTIDAGILELSF